MEVTIRAAREEDQPAILAIYNDAVLTTTATYDYEPRTEAEQAEWHAEHLRDGYPVFVAEAPDGQIVGWSSLGQFRERVGYRFTAEDSVYVAAACRGQGVGKRLIPPLIEAAKELGMHAIVAGIDADSQASVRLHERFGFRTVARFSEVGYKFGRWLDVIFMELLVEGS